MTVNPSRKFLSDPSDFMIVQSPHKLKESLRRILQMPVYTLADAVAYILREANPYHDPNTGEFSSEGDSGSKGKTGKMSATVGVVQALVSAGGFPHKVSSLTHGGVKVSSHSMGNFALQDQLESHGAVIKTQQNGDLHVTHFMNPSGEAVSGYVEKKKGPQKKVDVASDMAATWAKVAAKEAPGEAKAIPALVTPALVTATRDNITVLLGSLGHKVNTGTFVDWKTGGGFRVSPYNGTQQHPAPDADSPGMFVRHSDIGQMGQAKDSLIKAGATVEEIRGTSNNPNELVGLRVTHVPAPVPSKPTTKPTTKAVGKALKAGDIQPATTTNSKGAATQAHAALTDLGGGGEYGGMAEEYKKHIQNALADKLKDNAQFDEYIQRIYIKPYSAVATGYTQDIDPYRGIAVSNLISTWASTSGDTHEKAIAMQMAIKEEFGLQDASMAHLEKGSKQIDTAAAEGSQQFYKENGLALRAFARAMYDHTQEHLKSKGITHMTLYRGVRGEGPGIIHTGKLEINEVTTQPASSWSYQYNTAEAFAGHASDNPAILAARVPVGRILGTMRTGYGCKNEHEVVVLGGRDTVGVWGWGAGVSTAPTGSMSMLLTKNRK